MFKAKGKTIVALEIRSRPEHFYRAGRKWTKEAQVVAVSEFTKEQVKQLMAEPNLVVVEKDIEGEGGE